MCHRHMDERLAGLCESLEVLGQAAMATKDGEGALHDSVALRYVRQPYGGRWVPMMD